MGRGSLMSIKEAARVGETTTASIYNYIENGYLEPVMIEGYQLVYYRDVLRASWEAKPKNDTSKSKASKPRVRQLEDPVRGLMMGVTDAAKKAGVSRETLRLWYKKGYFNYVYIDGVKLVCYRDILKAAWLARQSYVEKRKKGRKEK